MSTTASNKTHIPLYTTYYIASIPVMVPENFLGFTFMVIPFMEYNSLNFFLRTL
nr:hypothetical protein [Cressdnaviricota sp.]